MSVENIMARFTFKDLKAECKRLHLSAVHKNKGQLAQLIYASYHAD